MVESLRSLRWRTAGIVAAAAVFLVWFFVSGRDFRYLIQIDYSWSREMLDSAEVVIDGVTVGVLQSQSRGQWVTGFRVEPGEHVVRIRKEGCESVPANVTLGPSESRFALLMAEIEDEYRCRVLLW